MPRWTYPVRDTRDGRVIHESVPFTGVRFNDSLSNGGAFTGSYPVGWAEMPDLPGDSIWKHMVWPCRDGIPQGSYIISNVQGNPGEPSVQVTGSRFDTILSVRELYHNLNFTSVDKFDIARDLIYYAQGSPLVSTSAGNSQVVAKQLPWLRVGDALSGVNKTIVVSKSSTTDEGYAATKGLFIGQMLDQLDVEARADYGWSDGMYWAQLTFGYPTVGRSASFKNKTVLEYPSPAVPSCQYAADGADYANRWRIVGKERDDTRPTGTAVGDDLDLGYPLIDRNTTSGALTEPGNLNSRAASQLRKAQITAAWNITLNADDAIEPAWGTYRIGDHVILRVKWGSVQMPDQVLRITGWEIAVDDTGEKETITPTLMDP